MLSREEEEEEEGGAAGTLPWEDTGCAGVGSGESTIIAALGDTTFCWAFPLSFFGTFWVLVLWEDDDAMGAAGSVMSFSCPSMVESSDG